MHDFHFSMIILDEQLLNFQFHSINGRFQLRGFIGGDGAGDDWSRNTASASQGNFATRKNKDSSQRWELAE